MNQVSMTGSDTHKINDRIITDLGDGDVSALTFPNEIATVKTGKNDNSIFALNASGQQAEQSMRVIRGSPDDKFLNNILETQMQNFAGFVLMNGEFVKQVGDGQGNVTADLYICSGGIMSKRVEAKSNVEGDTEQSLAVYSIKWAKAIRVIG